MSGNQAYLYPVTLNATTPHIVSAAPFLPIYRAYKKSKRHYHHLLSNLCSPSAPPPSPGSAVGILQIYGFRVYIANILLLLLLLTVSQVRCASAPVYSHQLIKFELLTQSIRQPSCQNIYMEDSVPLFSIRLYYTISAACSSIAIYPKFPAVWILCNSSDSPSREVKIAPCLNCYDFVRAAPSNKLDFPCLYIIK